MTAHLTITADLARAARALTMVSAKTIATAAGLDKQRLRDFERGNIDLEPAEQVEVRAALEKYGAEFLDEDASGGYGVRRKHTEAKVGRLKAWEDEGGPVADDAI